MAITLANYKFEGPYNSTGSLKNQSGVYAILTPTTSNRYRVVDVGESRSVRERVENHDRKSCWQRNATSNGIHYAVLYTPGQTAEQRRKTEKAVRTQYTPPCGKS